MLKIIKFWLSKIPQPFIVFFVLAILSIIVFFLFPERAHTEAKEVAEIEVIEAELPFSIEDTTLKYASLYGSNYNELMAVMKCESGYRLHVYGDGGRAYSLMQFHKPTFEAFSKELGETLDYYSPHDQIKLGAWAFAKGYQKHWTCASKLGFV